MSEHAGAGLFRKLSAIPLSVRWLVSGALLAGSLLASYSTAQRLGVDFASLHAMGKAIVTRTDVYDTAWQRRAFPAEYGLVHPPGMFYPPATGFCLVPFGLLPYGLGKTLWILTLAVGVVAGVRQLVRLVLPNASSDVWMALGSAALLSAVMRWGLTPLQGAPLTFGLLCFFVSALVRGKPRLATAIAVFATAFKMTLALPFLALLALDKRWRSIALVGGSWLLLNVTGFWLMGPSALASYREAMLVVEAFFDINSPDPWFRYSIPRLDWKYLLYGLLHDINLAQQATLLLAAATASWLGWFCIRFWRGRQPLSLEVVVPFLAAAVCLGSLCVYHHHYDASLFLAPALLLLHGPTRRSLPRRAWLMCLPLLAMLLLLPVATVYRILDRSLPAAAIGVFNLTFPLAMSLALGGSLVALSAVSQGIAEGAAVKRRRQSAAA